MTKKYMLGSKERIEQLLDPRRAYVQSDYDHFCTRLYGEGWAWDPQSNTCAKTIKK